MSSHVFPCRASQALVTTLHPHSRAQMPGNSLVDEGEGEGTRGSDYLGGRKVREGVSPDRAYPVQSGESGVWVLDRVEAGGGDGQGP